MSVTINIFANHNLCLGDNYSDAIRKIEEGLDLKVGESKEVSGEASGEEFKTARVRVIL